MPLSTCMPRGKLFSAPPTTRESGIDVNSTHMTQIHYISPPLSAKQLRWTENLTKDPDRDYLLTGLTESFLIVSRDAEQATGNGVRD